MLNSNETLGKRMRLACIRHCNEIDLLSNRAL